VTDTAAAPPLQASLLPSLGGTVAVPAYARQALRPSVFHIGVGGFHRAHLATYVDELCAAGHTDWAIVGCGVLERDAAMAEALGAQDLLYTLIVRGASTTTVQVIGSLVNYIHAYPDPAAAIEQIAHRDTQIISLTVTEGGYPVDDLTGEYLADSPNAGPTSAFGIIAAGLDRRRQLHGAPITILSCDNVMGNGHVAAAATHGAAAALGSDLSDWITNSVSFPNSMVDRITPATTDADRTWLTANHGVDDRWPVVTEPFRQWVVEDNFAGDRLPLEELDVIITGDVEPYEFMKLRLLNAGHSCLAYLAALDGIDTVDAAMATPAIARFVRAFLDQEAKPVLPPVAGIDIDKYNDSLIERFSNPEIGDQISRLCLDGTAKFPKFLLPTVRAQVTAGGPLDLCALALAGWCQYLLGKDDHGHPIALAGDPLLDEAVRFAALSAADPSAFLGFTSVFGDDLPEAVAFSTAFTDALLRLRDGGVQSAIEAALDVHENLGARPKH